MACRYTSSRTLEQDFYVEGKVLGSGMSGPVRLAVGHGDGLKYAVKSFSKAGISPEKRAELKSEVEIYLSLDHPHVARLEMVYETDEDLHLVMEYMAGGELYGRLEAGIAAGQPYTEEAAAETTHQMLLAVAYLHAHFIAHRDIKLENFLYLRHDSDHLKIIDFGFAKFTEQSTKMSQACGSIYYIAPEVLKHAYTEQADMWSLGVTVYMLLTGSPPFHGSDEEVLQKVRVGALHWSSRFHRLSALAKDFVHKLLVLDPSARISAQQALEHPWIKCRHEAPAVGIDAGMLESLRRFSQASHFRRNLLAIMAWSMSTEQRSELQRQFLAIDTNNSGTLSLQELKDVLLSHCNVEESEAEHLFRSLDADNDHEIEYTEFMAAALFGHVKVHADILQKTFSCFDRNGDGQIDKAELKRVLSDKFTHKEIDELMQEADASGDGKLDYDEFLAYFYKAESEQGVGRDEREKRLQQTEQLDKVIENLMCCESSGAPVEEPVVDSASTVPAPRPLPILLGSFRSAARRTKKA